MDGLRKKYISGYFFKDIIFADNSKIKFNKNRICINLDDVVKRPAGLIEINRVGELYR